ncbi:MAG: CvpA family protein [Moraxellaceae bacterium]|nr:CvpA family protein [Moraxellaceae bacterium]
MQVHTADWIILGIVMLSMAFGFFRGFVREAFALAGWVAAYVVARVFHAPLDVLLTDTITTPSLRLVAAWGGLFVTTLLLAALLGYMVFGLVERAGLRTADRLLGAGFGTARGVLLVLAILVLAAPFASRDAWWNAALLPSQFMRWEPVGRALKQSMQAHVSKAAEEAGKRFTPASPAPSPPAEDDGRGRWPFRE